MHMTLARELASQLGHGAPLEYPGAYYLGATAPDIRALTKVDRSETHFFNLTEFSEQRGVAGLFEAHPALAERGALSESTVAFLCGYISHLEMDETWICDIYRPCFGERSPLKGERLAALLDRILQFELDRRGRCDAEAIDEIRRELIACTIDVETPIADQETLARWRDVLVEVLGRPLGWERFGSVANRHVRAYGVESEEDAAKLLESIPDLLDQSLREVTQERLRTFEETARDRAREAIREYLS
jgi:hypothetical protein